MTEIRETDIVGSDELIVVKQLPIIEEQLHKIKNRLEEEVEYALSLECNEDTLQDVKKSRTYLSKLFKFLEDKRKQVKANILSPYEAFENVYKECVTNVYAPCDEKLAEKIHDVENVLKSEKETDVRDFFEEYKKSLGIDFVSFEQSGIKVSMTVSKKKLHEQAKEFLDKVAEDLTLIELQEHKDEVFVEYKNCLNIASAITAVTKRHAAIEEEQQKRAALEEMQAKQEDAVKKVEKAAEILTPPESVPETSPEKIYEVQFTVRASIEKLKALKQFLENGGYDYEQ